jgi:hypothetical protein
VAVLAVHMKAVLTKVDTNERYVFHDGLHPMNTPCKHRVRKVEGTISLPNPLN